MNILLPGGAGYIGSHTANRLINLGHKVVIVDDLSTGNRQALDERCTFIQGNCADEALMCEVIKEHKITSVMHFSGKISVAESMVNPGKYYYHNIFELMKVLDICVKMKIKNFVFSSTASIYGNGGLEKFDENAPVAPMNPYAQTKLDGENMIKSYAAAFGFNYCIFRYFNVAGAHESGNNGQALKIPSHIIPIFTNVALGIQDKLAIFGDDYNTKDGTCIRDYIHIEDLARAHGLGLDYIDKNNTSELFNLGSATGFSVKEVVSKGEEVLNIVIEKEIKDRRPGDPDKIIANPSKANSLLKWSPEHDLASMIISHYNWRKKNPNFFN